MYVYVLYSSSLKRYYVGSTDDVEKRLGQHNSGKGNYTSKGIPWEVVTTIKCVDRSAAMQLELKIKKRGIKRYLQDTGILQ